MFLIQNMQLAAGNDPFRDSRTPLDLIRDKLLTLIYFVIVQCSVFGRHGTVRVVQGIVAHELRGI